jgi:opacity protein-like surface antigen
MKHILVAAGLALALLATASTAAVAQMEAMPPLFVELWLPYVASDTLPTFPPCVCDPNKDHCVC